MVILFLFFKFFRVFQCKLKITNFGERDIIHTIFILHCVLVYFVDDATNLSFTGIFHITCIWGKILRYCYLSLGGGGEGALLISQLLVFPMLSLLEGRRQEGGQVAGLLLLYKELFLCFVCSGEGFMFQLLVFFMFSVVGVTFE